MIQQIFIILPKYNQSAFYPVTIKNHILQANKAIKNAQEVQIASKNILSKNKKQPTSQISALEDLYKTMDRIVKDTEKSIKGARLAESGAKSRLAAVKKATAQTIKHTAKAKRAALASKKLSQSALLTYKNINSNTSFQKKYQTILHTQINGAIRAAKESERQTQLALKSSITARQAARMNLPPLKI